MNRIIIIAGNMTTSFGNSMYVVALLIYITENRPHPFNIGAIQASAYLPIVLFGVYAGILADKKHRPGIIAAADIIRSILLLFAAAAMNSKYRLNPLVIFIPLVFLNAVLQAFFSPAVISYIMDQKERKPDLLSLRTGTGHLSALAGQILGAALFPLYGLIPLLLINSLCFFLSGISELFLKEKNSRKNRMTDSGYFGWKKIIGLSRDFFKLERMGAPVVLYLGMQAVNTMVVLNLPFYLTNRLGFSSEFIGYGLAGLLGGSILTGLFLGLSGLPSRVGAASTHAAALLFAVICLSAGMLSKGDDSMNSFILPLLLFAAAGACQGWIHLVTIHLVYKGGIDSSAASRQGFLEAAAAAVVPAGYIISAAAASVLPLDTAWLLRLAAVFAAGLAIYSLRRLIFKARESCF